MPDRSVPEQDRIQVGVWDLDLGEDVSPSVKLPLSDELRSELFLTGKFNVVEHNAMGRILEERDFQQTERVSNECIVEVGQLLGVEKMVAGSIGKVGAPDCTSSFIGSCCAKDIE